MVSNTLLKSKANTRTYGFVDNMEPIVWKMATNVAVVDPVSLNAY